MPEEILKRRRNDKVKKGKEAEMKEKKEGMEKNDGGGERGREDGIKTNRNYLFKQKREKKKMKFS